MYPQIPKYSQGISKPLISKRKCQPEYKQAETEPNEFHFQTQYLFILNYLLQQGIQNGFSLT